MFHHVSMVESSYSLWQTLESIYERKTATNKVFLIFELVNLKYNDDSFVAEHLNEVKNIVNELASMKVSLDDELQALLLLNTLPDS